MTDQNRITNICSSAAEEVSQLIAQTTRIPMLVSVIVTNAGHTIAEGYADTSDHLTDTNRELDPDT